jgi:hypothetical protein
MAVVGSGMCVSVATGGVEVSDGIGREIAGVDERLGAGAVTKALGDWIVDTDAIGAGAGAQAVSKPANKRNRMMISGLMVKG